jgi:hypothetical protein
MSKLYKQPNSPYWFYTLTVDGKRKRCSTKQRNKRKAESVLDLAKRKADVLGIDSLTRKCPTLKDFMSTFKSHVRASQVIKSTTRRFYQCGIDLLIGRAATEKRKATPPCKLAEMRLDSITPSDCNTTSFQGGPYNANKALRTLRKLLSLAHEKGMMGTPPKIEMREVFGRSIAMTREHADLIAAKMPLGDARDCFLVLRGTGMRPSEGMSMEWQFMRFDERLYSNPHGKTKSARRPVPLLNGSAEILKRRHLAAGTPARGWVFPAESKTGHMATITKAFERARTAAGLPKELCIYTARHGAITDLAKFLPIAEVMTYGGHTDVKVALTYQHHATADLQAKLDAATGRIQ